MVEYQCEELLEDGQPCPYKGTTEVGIKQHYKLKHQMVWPGAAAAKGKREKEQSPDEKWAEKETIFEKDSSPPNDPFDALRQIMHNNQCDKWREATISLFQNYDPEDYEGLEQILQDQHIPPIKRKMVMTTYRKMMGAPEPEEEEEAQPVKGKKQAPMMNPWEVGPEHLMTMSPGDRMRWKMAMTAYRQAEKDYQDEMAKGSVSQGAQPSQYPPEIQELIKEMREMKEREKQQQMFNPLLQRLEAIEKSLQQRGGAGGGGNAAFQDIYDKAMTFKLLDSLGNSKEVDGLRQEAEQRMEKIRLERDQVAANASQQIEALKTQTIQMQLATMDQNTRAQIASLQAQLANTKDAPGSMAKILDDYMALQQRVEQFRTGEAPKTEGEKKTEMVVGLLGDVAKTFQPTIQTAVQAMTQKNNNQARPNAPARPPMRNVQQPPSNQANNVQEANIQQYTCDFCGTPIQYVGNPSSITCPSCGQVFSNDATEARAAPVRQMMPTEQSQREPTEDELRANLIQQPRSALEIIARKRGIDPSAYATNEELVDFLLRMQK